MADKENIITELKCQNIAPIEDLTKEIKSGSLKMAVFANNGSGKTFLSRLFRLTENQEQTALDENGKSPTDKLLTFGKDSGSFSFKITDDDYKEVCEAIIKHIEEKYKGQIEYLSQQKY